MRLCSIAFILFLASVSIYHQKAASAQNETKVKNQQSNQPASVAAAAYQPDAKAQQDDAYDPRRDCLYRAYLVFTIIGVLVAMVAIGVFYLQTKATQDAAHAARFNAQAVVNSQRPWIAVRREEPIVPESFRFEAVCLSGIPAKVIHSYIDWQTVDRGEVFQPNYKTDMLAYPFLIAPSDTAKHIGDFTADNFRANAPLWNDIQNLTKTLYLLGKLEYIDGISFDENGKHIVHETRWCYQYIGGAILRSGPEGSNDCT